MALSGAELRHMRPKIQMIFQDSYAALNSRHSASKIVGKPLAIHGVAQPGSPKMRERVSELYGRELSPGKFPRTSHLV
jgi:oligopeptide transport system ATP-binding protein